MFKATQPSDLSFFQRDSLVDFLLLFALMNVAFGFLDLFFGPFETLSPAVRVAILLAITVILHRFGATRNRSALQTKWNIGPTVDGFGANTLERNQFYANFELALRKKTHGFLLLVHANEISTIDKRYGQQVGEYFLSSLAKRLTPSLMEEDLFGRLDRVTFAVFLSDRTQSEAELVARRMCGSTLIPLSDSAERAHLSSCVGYTEVQAGDSVLHTMERANEALVVAQHPNSGRMAIWSKNYAKENV